MIILLSLLMPIWLSNNAQEAIILITSVTLLVLVSIVVLTYNYFTVKQNWQKIHAIKFEQGARSWIFTEIETFAG